MTTYWELLRDPRWQQMRLKVMERDKWTCVECKRSDSTLNVHHTYYAKGRAPWEYEPESLKTLCEDCHELVSDTLTEIRRLAGSADRSTLARVLGLLRLANYKNDQETLPIENDEVLAGVHSIWELPPERIKACVLDGHLRLTRYFNECAVYNLAPSIRFGRLGLWLIDGRLRIEEADEELRRAIMAKTDEIASLLNEIARLKDEEFKRWYAAHKGAGQPDPDEDLPF